MSSSSSRSTFVRLGATTILALASVTFLTTNRSVFVLRNLQRGQREATVTRTVPASDLATADTVVGALHMVTAISSLPNQQAHVPLQDWEVQALNEGVCRPPAGTPEYCCPGSSSAGGALSYYGASGGTCHKNASVYEGATEMALSMFPPLLDGPFSATKQDCDVCRIMELMFRWPGSSSNNGRQRRPAKASLALVGDSVTRQTFSALECELRRRGFEVSPVEEIEEGVPIEFSNSSYWRYKMPAYEEFRVGWKATSTRRRRRLAAGNNRTETPKRDELVFRLFPMYRPKPSLLSFVANVTNQHAEDAIVVFDHGLHYLPSEMGEFRQDMKNLTTHTPSSPSSHFAATGDSNDRSTEGNPRDRLHLFWRETSAQHWSATGGHYRGNLDSCKGWNLTDYPPIYANEMQRMITRPSSGLPPISTVPFRNYSSHFLELHPKQDCSHFCHLPVFWSNLWRQLRLKMELRSLG